MVCPRRSQNENHRLARRKKSRQENHQLQIARLAVQPSALLGRAVPDCLEKWPGRQILSRSVAGKCVARFAANARRLQTHRHRRTAARPRQRLGESARRLRARNEHDAAMGRFVLVLSALLDAKNSAAFVGSEAENYWMGGVKFQDSSVQAANLKLETEN